MKAKVKTVPAEWLRDGVLLDRLADEYVRDQAAECPDHYMPDVMTVATFCSGAEGMSCLFDSLEGSLKEHASTPGHNGRRTWTKFKTVWMSEVDAQKRQWGMEVNDDPDCCAFGDVTGLKKGRAHCYRHDQECVVVRAASLHGGFSCKDMSTQSSLKDTTGLLLAQASSAGGSANTWNGFLGIIDNEPPDWGIIENLDNLDEEKSICSALELVQAQFGARSFECQPLVLESSEHGLPWVRHRTFILYVYVMAKMFRITGYAKYFKDFIARMERCKRRPPSLMDVLHDNDEEDIQSFLKSLPANGSDLLPPTADTHLTWLRTQDLALGAAVAKEETRQSPWFSKLPERQQQIIACTQAKWPSVLGVDASQNISRTPYIKLRDGDLALGPTIMPGGSTFVFGKFQRLTSGTEALEGQGFPCAKFPELMRKTSNTLRQSLGGNAFGYTVVLSLATSFMFNTTFTQARGSGETNSSKQDVDKGPGQTFFIYYIYIYIYYRYNI